MISKLGIIVLGILYESNSSFDDLSEMIDDLNIGKIFPVNDSILNIALKKLIKDGLIELDDFSEPKTFNITNAGKQILFESISLILDYNNIDSIGFDIGILLMNKLGRTECNFYSKLRLEKLEGEYFNLKNQVFYTEYNKEIPYSKMAVLKHKLYQLEAEIKIVKDLIREINKSGPNKHTNIFRLKTG